MVVYIKVETAPFCATVLSAADSVEYFFKIITMHSFIS